MKQSHKVGELDDLNKSEIDILIEQGLVYYCSDCGEPHLTDGVTWNQINEILN